MPSARKNDPTDAAALNLAFRDFTDAADSLASFYSLLEAEVARLRGELDEANRTLEREREAARRVQALAEMAALLAHEIRNPLASLELFAGLLRDETRPGSEARSWADQLQAGMRMLAATVNNVLQFHSPSGGGRAPLDPAALIEETVEFLEPMACQWKAELHLELNGAAFILAEPHGLRQVFLNLAINAFRAMPEGGPLRIGVALDDGWVRISFRDAGVGVAAADRERIFEAGFTTSHQSSGLGLAVCRRIVEANGGSIRVESTPGEGAAFLLSFPTIGVSR